MKYIVTFILILAALTAKSQVYPSQIQPGNAEHDMLIAGPDSIYNHISIDSLKSILGIDSTSIDSLFQDGVVDTFYNDGKDQLIIEVLKDGIIEKLIVDITDLASQNIHSSDVPNPTFRRYSIWLDNSDTIIIDDIFVDPGAVKYIDTTALLNPYLKSIDTASMLEPYITANEIPEPDLSGYVEYIDTSAMLSPYFKKVDTTSLLNPYLKKEDRYWAQSGIDIGYNLGNVGIGTNSPEEQLHVLNGDVFIQQSGATGAKLRFTNSVNEWGMFNNLNGDYILRPATIDANFSIKSLNNTEYLKIGANGITRIFDLGGNGNGLVQTNNVGTLSYLDYSTWDLNDFWTKTGIDIGYNLGDVGIGTNSPEEQLHVLNGDVFIQQSGATGAKLRFTNSVNEWGMFNNLNGDYILRPATIDANFSIKSLNNTEYFKIAANGITRIFDLGGNGNGLVQTNNVGTLSYLDYSTWDLNDFWTKTGNALSYSSGTVTIENNLFLSSPSTAYRYSSYENTSNKWLTGVNGAGDYIIEAQNANDNIVIRSVDNDEWAKFDLSRKKISFDDDDLDTDPSEDKYIAILQDSPTSGARKELVKLEGSRGQVLVANINGSVDFQEPITPATYYRNNDVNISVGSTYKLNGLIENMDNYGLMTFSSDYFETQLQGNYILTLSLNLTDANFIDNNIVSVILYNKTLSSNMGESRSVAVNDACQATFQFYAFLAAAYDYEIKVTNASGSMGQVRIRNAQLTFINID